MAVRKNILKLAKKISGATALMFHIDENAPEYYVLDCCVSDEQAEVGLAMELRKTQTIEQIAKKCGKSVEDTHRLAHELAEIGACVFHTENGVELFELTVFVPGVMEKIVTNKELCEKYPDKIGGAFEEYARLRGSVLSPQMPVGLGPMRVLPVSKSIDPTTKSCSYEEIETIINKNTLFAVSDCSCRRSRRVLGEGCGHLEHDICIQLGEGAEYYIKAGKAREITKEEAIAIIKKAEENGLMHNIPNIDGLETHAICNCCSCSCYALRNALLFNSPDMVRSNYVSSVDKDKCVACGQCVENCPTNALKLGRKLCASIPEAEVHSISPRDHKWTKDNWNVDYRDNRKDVLETGTSPCKSECPAHIAVQGYIRLALEGRYTDALDLIKKENPFPAVCGRVCPRKCESACTRGDIDEPVAIDEIKKFIADRDLHEDTRYIPVKKHEYDKKIAVVGAGPAGLSCAFYLSIEGYQVTVFEKQQKLGGMLTLGIPSYRLEKDVVNAEIDILKQMGVEFKCGVNVGEDITLDDLRAQGYEAFYLAIGAQGGRGINIPGCDAKNVIAGVDFLRNVNLGNDASLPGKVVVIGGGNVAIDVARTAIRENASSVNMFSLESREEMPALDEEIEETLQEGIIINNSWGPKEILTEDGKVTGITMMRCKSVFDENHRFAPVYDENDTMTIEADYILLSVGQSIEWGNLLNGSSVELRPNKAAIADELTYQTGQKDVFVGGDAYTGPRFAIEAIAAGKQGAISIHRFVWEGQSLTLGRDRRKYHYFDKDTLELDGFDHTRREKPAHKSENEKTFKDTRMTFTEDQVKAEAQRCLSCGAVSLDEEMCIGCGMCTTKCKFDAIKLVRKFDAVGTTFEKLPLKMAPNVIARPGRTIIRSIKDSTKK